MTQFRRATMGPLAGLIVALFIFTTSVSAQELDRPSSFLSDVFKQVVFDPTTYVPASTAYSALRLDWQSSQVFFGHGFMEGNPRYTISGRPNDIPLSYQAGSKQLVADTLAVLQMSVVNNVSTALFENVLARRYPEHQKLWKVLSWAERIAFASYLSARSSAHFQQWQQNERMARQYGYK